MSSSCRLGGQTHQGADTAGCCRGAEQHSLQTAASTAPHYGTKAAANALQQGIDAFNGQVQSLPALDAIKLPDLTAIANAGKRQQGFAHCT